MTTNWRRTTGIPATALADEAGLSYRQLDYWTRRGYLLPVENSPGSGRERHFTLWETRVARRMGGLVEAGLTVESASAIARGDSAVAARLLRTIALILDELHLMRGGLPAEPKETS